MLLPIAGSSRATSRCAAAGAEWLTDKTAAASGNSAAKRAAFTGEGDDRRPKLRIFVTFFSDGLNMEAVLAPVNGSPDCPRQRPQAAPRPVRRRRHNRRWMNRSGPPSDK